MLTDQDRAFLVENKISLDGEWPEPQQMRHERFRSYGRPVPQLPAEDTGWRQSAVDFKRAAENWCQTAKDIERGRKMWRGIAMVASFALGISLVAIGGLLRGIL
jgi:hypothetical protein